MLIKRPAQKALVVDDHVTVAHVVGSLLSLRGFKVQTASDPTEVLDIVISQSFDLVVLDVNMPGLNGLDLLHQLRQRDPSCTYVMITADGNLDTVIKALRLGAQGFVIKPFTHAEFLDSIDLALEKTDLMRQNISMRMFAPLLEGATAALLTALEARDVETQSHSQRVSNYAEQVALGLELDYSQVMVVKIGALFHDIGKIGIPDRILRKPSRLTPEERLEIQKHPVIGDKIIRAIEGMDHVADIVRAHHENFNGTGYPDQLARERIPLGARITTVTDCFEAMVSPRVYSPGRSVDEALHELRRCSGTQFDPEIVEVFLHKFETGQIIYTAPVLITSKLNQDCTNPAWAAAS
jgi:putative nucleotidyltransferase with HDIG domain